MKKILISFFFSCAALSGAMASSSHHDPDGHAPIGIMGDHIHKKGEFMVSYRYMNMGMEGVQSGQSSSSAAAARTQYMASPIEMNSQMHMVGAMYGLTEAVTLVAMGSFIEKDMTIERPNLTRFKRSTRGIGDTRVGAVTKIYGSKNMDSYYRDENAVYAYTALSLPTGDHDVRDDSNVTGYAMRLGSGTVDPVLGLTYVGKRHGYSFGGQVMGTFRLYKNDADFREGNRYQATAWTQFRLNDAFSVSFLTRAFRQDRTDGADSNVNRGTAFVFDPIAQEREGIDLGAGVNFIVPTGALKGQRFAIEATAPIYERINGYGLERDYRFTAGWQYAF